MELFDDWSVHPRASAPAAAAARRRPAPGREGAALATPQAIAAQLGAVEPAVIQVNCFEDVGYLWVQLSFDVVAVQSRHASPFMRLPVRPVRPRWHERRPCVECSLPGDRDES